MVKCLVGLLMVAAWSAHAEEPTGTKLPAVTFAPFPVSGKIAVVQGAPGVAGKSSDRLSGPLAPDHPPWVQVAFGDRVSDQNDSDYSVRVYRVDEVDKAPYPTIQPVVEELRRCLASRSKGDLDRVVVPVYPIPNAIQILRAKTRYFDAAWGSGVFFVAAFASGVAEYPENSSLQYLFEGVSKDGKYFVSAAFKIAHPKLDSPQYNPHLVSTSGPTSSAVRQANQKKADAATAKAQAFLPGEPDSSFKPSLSKLQRWMSTLTFREPWE